MPKKKILVPYETIERSILILRSEKVILDADLALFYGVTTKRLNEQVKRNIERFPNDFMFQLTKPEKEEVVANCDHLKNLKYSPNLPYAFTEHGVIMAATVLNSSVAIEASIFVVRAFVKFREIISAHKELTKKLKQLEKKIAGHDDDIQVIFEAINPVRGKALCSIHT
jgi:hypothetical protein